MSAYSRFAAQFGRRITRYNFHTTFTSIVGISYSLSANRTFCASAVVELERPKLYQYKICPFCNRVKSYLDFLGIEYDTVEVNPLTKSEIAFSKEHKKVPLAIIGDRVIGESGQIIEVITAAVKNSKMSQSDIDTLIPEDTAKWDEWSEKKLAVYLYPNITRSFSESWECFGYSKDIDTWSKPEQLLVRVFGAAAMSLANGKIKSKYGIKDERKELNEILSVWSDAVGEKKYLHGDQISLPDLMVFGVLKSIDGMQTFHDIMQDNTKVKAWYNRVAEQAASREGKQLAN